MLDRLIGIPVWDAGCLSNQKLCGRIIEYLAPIQLGEKGGWRNLAVERNVADEYFAMEEMAIYDGRMSNVIEAVEEVERS